MIDILLRILLTDLPFLGFEERFQKEANVCSSSIRPSLIKVSANMLHFPFWYSIIWTLHWPFLCSFSRQNTCRRTYRRTQPGWEAPYWRKLFFHRISMSPGEITMRRDQQSFTKSASRPGWTPFGWASSQHRLKFPRNSSWPREITMTHSWSQKNASNLAHLLI